MMVKFKRDRQTNTYSWIYTGGCFEGDKAVMYRDAHIGETQDFRAIQFEVRLDTRPSADLFVEEDEDEE